MATGPERVALLRFVAGLATGWAISWAILAGRGARSVGRAPIGLSRRPAGPRAS
jgi:hypothetical protein